MFLKNNEIEIDPAEPFKNCVLGRQKYSLILTKIISTYADGFVLAINNEWGTGKTTFVKMWRQSLEIENFKTLYFNAWENDFDNSPLIALISELKTLLKNEHSDTYRSLLKKGAIVAKSILPSLLQAIASKYIDRDVINDAIKNTAEAATEIFKDEIDEYAEKKKGLIEFRKELENYVATISDGKPLVFIVDEIDRCRPDYAVMVLEYIKHFFNVPGIVFIISIDKTQLSNAIKGYYGNDQINTEEYLRRFIDIEYSIPKPSSEDFCKSLFQFYQFDEFFYSPRRTQHRQFDLDAEKFITIASVFFNNAHSTLRIQQKVFAHISIVLRYFEAHYYILPRLFFVLVFLKVLHIDLFNKILNKSLSFDELMEEFYKVASNGYKESEENIFQVIEAELVYRYANYVSRSSGRGLVAKQNENDLTNLAPKFNNDSVRFFQLLDGFAHEHETNDTSLEYLLNKITFTDKFPY